MQSILQYRRFKKHVTAQYDKDREKTLAAGHLVHDGGESSPDTRVNSTSEIYSPVRLPINGDLEKAETPTNRDSDIVDSSGGGLGPRTSNSSELGHIEHDGSRPDMLRNASTRRSARSMGTNIGYAMTGIVVRDRTTHEGKGEESRKVFVVGYEGENDQMNPHNWSRLTRWKATWVSSKLLQYRLGS